jgi:cysteinyl-tRNA synthetase
MSHKYLGFGFDIHGGGLDLIFPHHENEIAQAEGSTGEAPFVRYWMHNGFVTMSGEKMAKSVGNVIRVRDALAEADAMAIRTLFLGTHYRSPIDFNADKLTEAGKAYQRLNTVIGAIDRVVADYREPVKVIIGSGKEDVLAQEARQAQSDFETAMDDDFNAPDALGSLFTLARRTNSFIKDRSVFSLDELDVLADVKEKMEKMGGALGLLFSGFSDDADDVLKDKIERLIEQRGKAKADKDWQTADALRGELQGMGVVLEDTPDGTKWRRIKRHS